MAFLGNREWREGVYLGDRAHIQGFGPTRPSCPDAFRPPSHSSFIPGPLLDGTSPLFLPQTEPGSGHAPPPHMSLPRNPCGAGGWAHPSRFSCSLVLWEIQPLPRSLSQGWGAPSFPMIATLPGGLLDSTPSKMRDGMAQWLEFACCL